MTQMLRDAARNVRSSLMSERDARAHGAQSRGIRHFAAVMGDAINESLTESPAYRIADVLQDDPELQSNLQAFLNSGWARDPAWQLEARANLNHAMIRHVQWTLHECRAALLSKLPESEDSNLSSSKDSGNSTNLVGSAEQKKSGGTGLDSALQNPDAAALSTDDALAKLDEIIELGSSKEVEDDVHKTRLDFIEHQKFVSAKAEELQIVTHALSECDDAIKKLKDGWDKPYRLLYQSEELKELQEEKDRIAKDKTHQESELQGYFDHVSSSSKGEKVDKTFKLTLATDLETRMAGFRQIQLVDLYCLSRGKEMWAILPSITRIGHDIDPNLCMHWRPEVDEMPEALKPFWKKQSRAFAKQLLMICTPSQRSTLLGTHEFGTKKVSIRAPEDCGVMIYWVMVQLYHPIDRNRRRELEIEISKYGNKFKTGNVQALVKELREKLQEAKDMSCRLKWDVVAHPIVQSLTDRHARFEVQLEPFLEMPAEPDNCGEEFGKLLTKISTTAKSLVGVTDTLSAKSAKKGASDQDRLREMEKTIASLQAKLAGRSPRRGTAKTAGSFSAPQPGYCWGTGCTRKIEGYSKTKTPHWRVCGTCLLKLRSGEKDKIPLVDGSNFGSQKYAKKIWEEYRLPEYKEPSPKAKSAGKGGRSKGSKGGRGKGKSGKGNSPYKRRAYSAREAEEGSPEPRMESEEEEDYEEWDPEDSEEREWEEERGSPKRAKLVSKETSALDSLFY